MILKSPESRDDYVLDLTYTASARAGWRHLLRSLSRQVPFKILLPAYIGYTEREGSGVFDPVQETNTEFEFYPVNSDLSPKMDVLKERLASGEFQLLLIIHYFGFCQSPIREIKELCKFNNIILVEDCAHTYSVLKQQFPLGGFGDFSFYSLHKFFPLASGGVLRRNNRSISLMNLPDEDQCESKVLQQVLCSDVDAIIAKRIENYLYLYNALKEVTGIKVMYSLKEGILPHDFPILVEGGLREKLYFKLFEYNIPTIALYYRLIDAIKSEEFPVSFEISNAILNLPVHQDTHLSDLDYIVAILKNVLSELNDEVAPD